MKPTFDFFEERELLLNWLHKEALWLWSSRGVDKERGGFFEKLTPEGFTTDDPRRARVVGRQIYSFATAESLGWPGPAREMLQHGLAILENKFFNANGTITSAIEADGHIIAPAFDLYDHAFVLFGLAAAHRAGERPAKLHTDAVRLLRCMRNGWAHPIAGFEEAHPRSLPLRANPHMHMLEASLAWSETAPNLIWDKLADEIAELCMSRFFDRNSGAIRELFDGDWQVAADDQTNLVEPGHQFEWAWLLIRWGILRGRDDAVSAGRRLINIAETFGVDRTRRLVVNTLTPALKPQDTRARLWPQTERIKAFVALSSIATSEIERLAAIEKAAEAVSGLRLFFDHPIKGAWWEHIACDGVAMREPSRASSLYHIICAAAELQRVE